MRSPARLSALVFACVVSLAASVEAADRVRPNILFIMTDDQRPDTIHALGNPVIETPNLDRLVESGTVFRRAISPNPICVCARAELLSGLNSFHNGIAATGKLDRNVRTIAQLLADAGYRTIYSGKWHTAGRPSDRGYQQTAGLMMGGGPKQCDYEHDFAGRPVTGYRSWVFQTEDGRKFPERGVGLTPRTNALITDDAIAALEHGSRKPFFLHVNFTGPHDPLLLPDDGARRYDAAKIPLPANFLTEHPFDYGNLRGRDEQLWPWPRTSEMVRQELAAYYSIISHLDAQIGRLLAAVDRIGQRQNTIVIFTSDQGLGIGSHGIRGKQNMYDHTIHTPLVIAGPGIPAGRRIDAQVYLRDLFPTICDFAGAPVPKGLDAHSLLPLIAGTASELYPEVFTYFTDTERAVRTDRWKLIEYPKAGRRQLFDLAADPNELNDLSDEPDRAGLVHDLHARLVALERAAGDPLVTDKAGQAR